jgi:hypothetical protein
MSTAEFMDRASGMYDVAVEGGYLRIEPITREPEKGVE